MTDETKHRNKDALKPGTAAVKFLSDLRPGGRPAVITAITPDGPTTTRTFTDLEKARQFILKQNAAGRNIYFTHAILTRPMDTKPRKDDVAAIRYLHVDADPREDETAEDFKARKLPQIDKFEPAPTFVVATGNGIQLLWELKEAVAVTSPEVIADIEARNHALAIALGANPVTRNIERLLRVPGTINYPNAKKRKDGRVKCRARYLRCNDNDYPLSAFAPYVEPTKEKTKTEQGSATDLPAKLVSLLHISNPDAGGYKTRSELLFAFLMSAIRANVTDAAIIAAVLDNRYAGKSIYEHVDEQGGRKCAERQLAHARDKVTSGASTKTQDSPKQYDSMRAIDIPIRSKQWLWPGHLLRGAQELMTGIKGQGKSQIQCSYVACVTTGRRWPDGSPGIEPSNVIMVTAEDPLAEVLVPRLIAARADLNRVFFLKRIKQDEKSRSFLLGEDLDILEQMITDIGNVALVTIDPITAFMGKINSHNTTDVRGQLGPLADLAERTNVAFSTITHPPKQGGQQAMNHFVGSQAFITAARIGHMCVPEMKVDLNGIATPTGRKLFTLVATNHQPMPTLRYRIELTEVQHPRRSRANPDLVEAVYVDWLDAVEITADEALAATQPKAPPRTADLDRFLRGLLNDGPMPQEEVATLGEKKGFNYDQLKRAKKRLGVVSKRIGQDRWDWSLPTRKKEGEHKPQ